MGQAWAWVRLGGMGVHILAQEPRVKGPRDRSHPHPSHRDGLVVWLAPNWLCAPKEVGTGMGSSACTCLALPPPPQVL